MDLSESNDTLISHTHLNELQKCLIHATDSAVQSQNFPRIANTEDPPEILFLILFSLNWSSSSVMESAS